MAKQEFYRDPQNGQFAGVCVGISNVYDIDVNVRRILAIPFFWLYLVAVIVLPTKEEIE
jgi:phage shock protein PspC (stress-responsive transcriptional regulator)